MGARNPEIENRKARHRYDILETLEAGIALKGAEVKAAREGRVQLQDAFARIEKEEAFLYEMHVSFSEKDRSANLDPKRPRKLLLHKAQIRSLAGQVQEKGRTLVPLKAYFKNGKLKILLGLAKGRKGPDKRRALRERTLDREAERALSRRRRL